MPIAVHPDRPASARRTFLVAVAGNPNSGKTTIFNALTGLRHKVGNYPGVTVEKRYGVMIADTSIRLLDLPGTYSLAAHSPDEMVARDVLLGSMSDMPRPDAVLIVIDGGNLDRNLYLATQIIELGFPAVIACNMMDVVRQAGHQLNLAHLSQRLGVPAIATVGARGEGVRALQEAIQNVCHSPAPQRKRQWQAIPAVEREIAAVQAALLNDGDSQLATDGLAVLLLSDGHAWAAPRSALPTDVVDDSRRRLTSEEGIDPARELTVARYAWLEQVVRECLTRSNRHHLTATDRLDRVLAHKTWGLLIFAPMMALLFYSIFVVAEPLMGWIESLCGGLRGLLISWMPEGVLRDLLVDGVLAGVGNVLVFFPQICILFLFIAVLEDTGYMARAAFLMNRIMSRVGLHGKSFIPLLSSHACAVPGIMATRTIENPRDRLVTILVAPLMGCSARMPVYTLLIAACLPGSPWIKAVALLTMYGLGVLTALIVATVFKRTLLRGPAPAFFIELPPYHWPQVGNVLSVMWDRSRLFLTQAGTIILAVTVVLWALMNFPTDKDKAAWYETQRAATRASASESGGNTKQSETAIAKLNEQQASERIEYSIVGRLGHTIAPLIEPLGYDWKIGVSIVTSIAAREVFVSTMGIVYNAADADSRTLRQELAEARWPDGRRVFTPLVAVGLMIFYVLACQCISTLAVVRRETNSWRWPLFMFAYMSVLAYVAALIVYQAGSALGIGVR